jgi:hypothetical protein
VGAPKEAGGAIVVGEVEAVGVVVFDLCQAVDFTEVPTYEMGSVWKAIPPSPWTVGSLAVFIPGGIEGLGVAEGC